jgi:hypothetical protein
MAFIFPHDAKKKKKKRKEKKRKEKRKKEKQKCTKVAKDTAEVRDLYPSSLELYFKDHPLLLA